MNGVLDAQMESYWKWLRDKTVVRQLEDDWVEITTPHLDRHNDMLQIYARRENGGFLLTDDGYVIGDLEQSGCPLDSPKRKHLLNLTLAGFGVSVEKNRLEVHANESDFPLRKHSLVQAMLAVNDMFYLARESVANLFQEDVQGWLDGHDIRYTPHVTFTGKSGFPHTFEFVIPKSRKMGERVVQTINHPSKQSATDFAFKWVDTKEVRAAGTEAFAILNDSVSSIPGGVSEALDAYGIRPVRWSEREAFVGDLAI